MAQINANSIPILVPSPVLTSKKSDNPNDPNVIAKNAIYLLNQSTVDKKYDPVPDPRIDENFRNPLPTHLETSTQVFIQNNPFPISLGVVGALLVLAGFFL